MKIKGFRKCRGKCQKEKPYGAFGRYDDPKKTMHTVCKECKQSEGIKPVEEVCIKSTSKNH